MGTFLSGLESFAGGIASIFNINPTITISPHSAVSTQIQLQPLSSTFIKDASGNSVLSVPAQVQVANPLNVLVEWAGKIFNPVRTGMQAGAAVANKESSPVTATSPVKNTTPDLASIFNLAGEFISLGQNIFGTTTKPATAASASSISLIPPAPSAVTNYYPSGSVAPTSSNITSIFSSTKTDTTNTASSGNLWWIIIILAILMIIAMTRKG